MLEVKDRAESGLTLVPSAQKLLHQITSRWPETKNGESVISSKNETRELVIDKPFGVYDDPKWLANQLVAYCKGKKPGSIRLSLVYNGDEVASSTHQVYFWSWRNWKNGPGNKIKIIFNSRGDTDPLDYDIPILVNGQSNVWSGEVPFYDKIVAAINTNSADGSVWNLACRLKELGFIEESVLPEGRQKYPKNAIRNLQDYMGLERTDYNEKLHRFIWGEFSLSLDTP